MATTKTTIPSTSETDAPALEAPTASATASSAPANTLSIISVVTAIVSFAVAQPALAVVAIVLGFLGRTREPAAATTANWGIVLGFVSLFGGFLLAAIGIAAFIPLAIGGTIWGW